MRRFQNRTQVLIGHVGGQRHGHVLRNETIVSQRRLAAHIGASRHPIGDEKGMGFDFLEGRCQRIQVTPQPVDPSGPGPAVQLSASLCRAYVARKEQAGFKDRLFADKFDLQEESEGQD